MCAATPLSLYNILSQDFPLTNNNLSTQLRKKITPEEERYKGEQCHGGTDNMPEKGDRPSEIREAEQKSKIVRLTVSTSWVTD